VAAKSETEVWLAGYAEVGADPKSAHIERWDGERISADEPMTDEAPASALSAIAVKAGHMAAVGWRTTPSGPNQLAAALLPTG
jgi:hypothetical protein